MDLRRIEKQTWIGCREDFISGRRPAPGWLALVGFGLVRLGERELQNSARALKSEDFMAADEIWINIDRKSVTAHFSRRLSTIITVF
jgi:hypothetical protein